MGLTLANGLVAVDLILFDNVRNFSVNQQIRVTEHPVEFGVSVSDHAQILPVVLSFEAQVTNSPLLVPNPTGVELATAWFERNYGQAITVTTRDSIFENMMLLGTNYTLRITKDRWFQVQARQVRIAFGVAVPIPPRLPNPDAAAGAASETAGGVQPPIPTPPPPPTSILGAAAAVVP